MPPKPCTLCLKPHYGEEDTCIVCRTKEEERFKGAADAMGEWMPLFETELPKKIRPKKSISPEDEDVNLSGLYEFQRDDDPDFDYKGPEPDTDYDFDMEF